MSQSAGAICSSCRITRPLAALIAVTALGTGARRYVCRPSLPQPHGGRPCFGTVRTADVEAIALALDARGERTEVAARKAKRQAEAEHVERLARGSQPISEAGFAALVGAR